MLDENSRSNSSSCVLVKAVRIRLPFCMWLLSDAPIWGKKKQKNIKITSMPSNFVE